MLEQALKILKKINDNGYSAYIVGGFVRDYILGIKSSDIDICTNAKPKELLKIFDNAKIPKEDYGSVTIYSNNIRFEITTFRRDIKYVDNRKPVEVEYIDSLELDVLRRDFTINTLCMDVNKNIIDILDGRRDIDSKIIRTVGDSNNKFSEDALRILRAVRFATKLNFELDKDVVNAIKKNKHLLKNISYERKREELDKIFTSSNNRRGIELLINLGLDEDLEIPNLKKVTYTDSLVGIWAVIDRCDIYHFNSNEKDAIEAIKNAMKMDILDPYNLFNNGLYVSSVVGGIKNISNEDITFIYNNLPIHSRKDIDIKADDIIKLLNKEPGKYINDIYIELEKEILYDRLTNNKKDIKKYLLDKYK